MLRFRCCVDHLWIVFKGRWNWDFNRKFPWGCPWKHTSKKELSQLAKGEKQERLLQRRRFESSKVKNKTVQGRPGDPVVKTVLPTQEDMSSIPDWGTKIPHAKWYGQKQFLSKKN